MTKVSVTIETAIDKEHSEEFYDLYIDAFGPLRTRAAARQVLHREEFFDEMTDPRVWKYVAWSEAGHPVGLSTMTHVLETVPWISPEYFRARFPEQAARGAVYYLGFALVNPRSHSRRVLEEMLAAWQRRISEDRAVCAWDMCAYNRDVGFGDRIETLLRPVEGVEVGTLDTQTYYAARYL